MWSSAVFEPLWMGLRLLLVIVIVLPILLLQLWLWLQLLLRLRLRWPRRWLLLGGHPLLPSLCISIR